MKNLFPLYLINNNINQVNKIFFTYHINQFIKIQMIQKMLKMLLIHLLLFLLHQ